MNTRNPYASMRNTYRSVRNSNTRNWSRRNSSVRNSNANVRSSRPNSSYHLPPLLTHQLNPSPKQQTETYTTPSPKLRHTQPLDPIPHLGPINTNARTETITVTTNTLRPGTTNNATPPAMQPFADAHLPGQSKPHSPRSHSFPTPVPHPGQTNITATTTTITTPTQNTIPSGHPTPVHHHGPS